MSYRLSYVFNETLIEKFSEDEIELVEDIMDMERDVGMFCYGVKIEEYELPENYERRDRKESLNRIKRFAEMLIK